MVSVREFRLTWISTTVICSVLLRHHWSILLHKHRTFRTIIIQFLFRMIVLTVTKMRVLKNALSTLPKQ